MPGNATGQPLCETRLRRIEHLRYGKQARRKDQHPSVITPHRLRRCLQCRETIASNLLALGAKPLIFKGIVPRLMETVCGCWLGPRLIGRPSRRLVALVGVYDRLAL